MRVCVKCFAFLSALSLFFVCNAFAEASTSRDSVMNLFVHDYEETKSIDSLSLVEKFSESEMLRQEFDQVKYLRNAMRKALQDDNLVRLKKLVDVAESYEKTSTYFIIHDSEKLLLKYFLGDFESLSDVQFVSRYNARPDYVYDTFHKTFKEKLKAEIESGILDEKLKSVENESDRIFICIVLKGFFKYKYDVPSLIEEHKLQLKKREQLEYLVDAYWDKKEVDPLKSYTFFLGGSYVAFLGDISDKVKNGFGFYGGTNWYWNNVSFEGQINAHFNDVRSSDTLHFSNLGWNLNVGYYFRDISLLCYLTTGVEADFYGENKSNDDKNRSSMDSYQVYPVYGAGILYDMFYLRFRSGIKNIWGDHTVNASGFRFYMSIEFSIPVLTMKPVEFVYPDTMER
ncbi:P2 domain protein [Fibrobacter succinogenes subsp. succinogenes S85]|uniref:p2 domain protein n=2 Tax=Fibrobacter succinogenes (strain ATCC 19169 / S85) TaxID=59374 RepID=D9S5X2_FIBSS|nr:hypothetical protein [Fibrobacter succinogenes]ADL25558.1 P2 domain protein [Fibrobacter succinogenes subsp. succinogenes S85]